jgi:hypothetical protein
MKPRASATNELYFCAAPRAIVGSVIGGRVDNVRWPKSPAHRILLVWCVGALFAEHLNLNVEPLGDRGTRMNQRTRYWTLHWVRAAFWPLPVLAAFKATRAAVNAMRR